MKKRTIVISAVLLCVFVLLGLASFRNRVSNETIQEKDGADVVYGVNEFFPSICVTEGGFLYAYMGNVHYFDLEADEEYVVCSKANCTHLKRNCGAYYGNGDDMDGLALYRGWLYRLEKNARDNKFELVRTDTAGNQRKVIAALDIGDYENGAWHLSDLQNAVYKDGTLWVQAAYVYVEENGERINCGQCLGIDVQTGDITEVEPLQPKEYDYTILGVLENALLLRKDWVDTDAGNVEMESWCVYDVAEGTMEALEENPKICLRSESGDAAGSFPKYIIDGVYGNGVLCHEVTWEKSWMDIRQQDVVLYVWDLTDGTKRVVAELEHSELMRLNEDKVHDVVIDGTKLLYMRYVGEHDKEICLLDLVSGNTETLYAVDGDWDMRIAAETADGNAFLIKQHEKEDITVGIISKKDFYAGNFTALRPLYRLLGFFL